MSTTSRSTSVRRRALARAPLDLRAGTLTRQVEWSSPAGNRVKVTSVRMVSLAQRAIAAIRYTVEPVDEPLRLVIQSELVANEVLPDMGKDPRVAAVLESPLVSEEHVAQNDDQQRVVLVHRTKRSGLMLAAGMSHEVAGPERMAVRTESGPDLGRTTLAARVGLGEQLESPSTSATAGPASGPGPRWSTRCPGALARPS